MEIIRIPRIMQDTSQTHAMRGQSVGFVPTMGALHEGHMSLVRTSKQENDVTVVSIFINPTQFAPGEDLDKYPRDFDGDLARLREAKADALFFPEQAAMYPERFDTKVDIPGLSGKLCGAHRPGHFSGVATVVLKLLNIVLPRRAYFGLKDYQQSLVIKRLATDLNLPVEIVTCPTRREPDGLAMSSRNLYLKPEERKAASIIFRTLTEAAGMITAGEPSVAKVTGFMKETLSSGDLISAVDYAGVYDPETLDELTDFKDLGQKLSSGYTDTGTALLAAAVRIGGARLIDNILL